MACNNAMNSLRQDRHQLNFLHHILILDNYLKESYRGYIINYTFRKLANIIDNICYINQ